MIDGQLVGGGYVRRRFYSPSQNHEFLPGEAVTGDQLRGFRNLTALVEGHYVDVYPAAPKGERFLVSVGKGLFDVVEGRRLNDLPLSKDDAEELLTRP